MIALDVAGWTGALGLLLAYALLSGGRVAAASPTYLALNLGGSAGLAVNGIAHGAWPSTALNVAWLAIGVQAVRAARARPATRPD